MSSANSQNTSPLERVLPAAWKMLHKGVGRYRHPFHRAVLSTVNDNTPELRSVILRGFSEHDRILIFHCDIRSAKVQQIRENPNVSCLFYHPKKWLQLRFSGIATVHSDDETAETEWEKMKLSSRVNYGADSPPGSRTQTPVSGPTVFPHGGASRRFEHSHARRNFAVMVCRFDHLDWLHLKLTGHKRAIFHWENNRLEASWVIP